MTPLWEGRRIRRRAIPGAKVQQASIVMIRADCINCGRAVKYHRGNKCLFEATSLEIRLNPKDGIFIRIDGEQRDVMRSAWEILSEWQPLEGGDW